MNMTLVHPAARRIDPDQCGSSAFHRFFVGMHTWFAGVVALVMTLSVAHAQAVFTVQRTNLTDQKAVFATVESPNVVPARARIGGTVASLSVRQGDSVAQGQVIAVVGDDKLVLQIKSLDAQIAGLESQLAQAQ